MDGKGGQDVPYSNKDRWVVIYPAYIDSRKTIAEGRKIPKELNKQTMVQTTMFLPEEDDEIAIMAADCSQCGGMGENRSVVTVIPGFNKQLVISNFRCNSCTYVNQDVMPMSGIPTCGTEVLLTVTSLNDLQRDMFSSLTCLMSIDDVGLEFHGGPMAAKFCTVESLIDNIIADVSKSQVVNAVTEDPNGAMVSFLEQVYGLLSTDSMPWTLRLRDPLGNSYIGSLTSDETSIDSNLKVSEYTRTDEENKRIGYTLSSS